MVKDAASAGSAKTIMTDVTRIVQTKSGTSRMVIPGARSVAMVTARLMADPMELAPIISKAKAQ